MNNALLLVMSITGLLALYWVLLGQWKYNRAIKEAEPVEVKEADSLPVESVKVGETIPVEDKKVEEKFS